MDYFNILPMEIIYDILTRIPAELVLDCKSVSKTWRNLIQDPSFSKMHVNRLNHHVESGEFGFLALESDMRRLYYFEYIENHEKRIDGIRRINLTPPLKCDKFVGSVNGLICLYEWSDTDRFCICNPLTKEYVFLPELMQKPGQYCSWVGFGYHPSTNEYKVVRVHELKTEPSFGEVMVYTLGSGSGWRSIGKFHLKFNHSCYSVNGIFVDGALHWKDREGMILVFDLADENFRAHVLPPPPSPTHSCFSIGVLNGFLYCAQRYHGSAVSYQLYLDLWLHRKKNVNYETNEHQSLGWTKEFTAAANKNVFAFTKSGSFLSYSSTYVNIYDPKGATAERLVDFRKQICQISSHKNTLVSLKDLGEENTKIRSKKAAINQPSSCS
ncbi:F-box protein CPR1-like [Papaver somniferum]|uniref:F-box protein CPR1-like n=1 Tax=Papaver somniferum TaxID=3469 RepID=UPI000E6F5B3E|nr:F-box protein CPR1-like [Papaver somniferum]